MTLIGIHSLGFLPGRIGGTESYFRNLVSALQLKNTDYDFIFFARFSSIDEIKITNEKFNKVIFEYDEPPKILNSVFAGRIYRKILRTAGFLNHKRLFSIYSPDLLHEPFTFLHSPISEIPSNLPIVLTIHDIMQEYIPDLFSEEELKFRSESYLSSAQRATKIIADSNWTKETIIEKYRIDSQKIVVIYPCINTNIFKMFSPDNKNALINYLKIKKIDKPFFYYPSATWEHKNHIRLIEAFRLLIDEEKFDGMLVFSGSRMDAQNKIEGKIRNLRLENYVKILNYIPVEEVKILYNTAMAVIFPSLFEGFGLPVLEAMACGCPVICSKKTSLPEVYGDSALSFNPYSVEEIKYSMSIILKDNKLKDNLISKGLERVKLFGMGEFAEKILQVYESILK